MRKHSEIRNQGHNRENQNGAENNERPPLLSASKNQPYHKQPPHPRHRRSPQKVIGKDQQDQSNSGAGSSGHALSLIRSCQSKPNQSAKHKEERERECRLIEAKKWQVVHRSRRDGVRNPEW